jgi:hypothetical protein
MLVAVFRMAEPDLLADSPRISPTLLPVFPTFSCERWEKCGRSPGHVWEHVERRVGEIVVSDETTGSGMAWVLPKNCLRIVWILPEDCSPTGNIQRILREYPENTQRILRQFPYNYQTLINPNSDLFAHSALAFFRSLTNCGFFIHDLNRFQAITRAASLSLG